MRPCRKARHRICARPQRVLLLPPDITRMHSGAGRLTEMLYNLFSERRGRSRCDSDARPACVAHGRRKPADVRLDPQERIHRHDWRERLRAGRRDSGPVRRTDDATGVADWSIPIELNRMLMEHRGT